MALIHRKPGALHSYLRRQWVGFKLRIINILFNFGQSLISYQDSSVRRGLPADISEWRSQFGSQTFFAIWNSLRPLFKREGYCLWMHDDRQKLSLQIMDTPSAPGHWFQNPGEPYGQGSVTYCSPNGRQHAMRGPDGKDYLASVASMAGSDKTHLKILRRLCSAKPDVLSANNHILPVVKEIFLQDVVFIVMPLLRASLRMAIFPFPEKSIDDLLNMALQAIEATKYIHSKNIAHRDLFTDNFVVEWIPESINAPCCMRPRVYLIDFESAVEFPPGTNPVDCVCDSLPSSEPTYMRPRPRELEMAPLRYCPFRLDLWQLGYSLADDLLTLRTTCANAVWAQLRAEHPEDRATAEVALDTLRDVINSIHPSELLLPSAQF